MPPTLASVHVCGVSLVDVVSPGVVKTCVGRRVC